jgi:two-component system, chemotaxis family, response regulator Rcp1
MNALNILLAEDNRADIPLVQKALDEHKIQYALHVVRDGEEALAFIRRMGEPDGPGCPDIVLLDLNLPKIDGTEVLAEFRKHPQCAHTPVIVISSSDAHKDRERMAALGVARYFRKPSDLDAFLRLGAIVREVMDGITGN